MKWKYRKLALNETQESSTLASFYSLWLTFQHHHQHQSSFGHLQFVEQLASRIGMRASLFFVSI